MTLTWLLHYLILLSASSFVSTTTTEAPTTTTGGWLFSSNNDAKTPAPRTSEGKTPHIHTTLYTSHACMLLLLLLLLPSTLIQLCEAQTSSDSHVQHSLISDLSNTASIGLNVKTPLFVGGLDEDHSLPAALDGLAGFSGCISKVRQGGSL